MPSARATGCLEGRAAFCAAAVTLSVALLVSTARAQPSPLAEADAAFEGAELDRALRLYEQALDAGGHPPATLARVHRRLGVLYASTGDDDAAVESFALALALEPSMEAPPELGPAQRAVFESTRAERGGRPIRLELRAVGPVRPGQTELAIELHDAPDGAVAQVRVRAADWSAEAPAGGSLSVPETTWGEARALDVRGDALDARGNVLAHAETRLTRLDVEAEGAPAAAPSEAEASEGSDDGLIIGIVVAILVAGAIAGGVTAGILLSTEDQYFLVPRFD